MSIPTRTAKDVWDIVSSDYENLRIQLWSVLLWFTTVYLASAGVMWWLNITGQRNFNIIPALVGIVLIAMIGTKTKLLAGFSVLGLVFSFFGDQKAFEGIKDGVKLLFRLLITVLMVYGFTAFLLTTFTFENHPELFWWLPFAALIGVIAYHFDKSMKTKTWKIVAYPVILIAGLVAVLITWDTILMYLNADYLDDDKVVVEEVSSPPQKSRTAEISKPEAIESACGPAFASVNNCVKVTFRNGGTYDYRALSGHCPGYDRKGALNIKPIEDGFTHRYSSKYPGRDTVVHFYSLSRGQTMLGYTCGS